MIADDCGKSEMCGACRRKVRDYTAADFRMAKGSAMTAPRYDVLGIGNAIVDVLARTDDAFLRQHGLVKGAMTLIDAERAEALYGAMGPGIEISGGSAANTLAGVASLGGRAAYIGKVRDDQLGAVFRHDIRAAGVAFDSAPALDGASTARCLVLVTPDAQRTMQTYLGACVELGPDDVTPDLVAAAQITYLEGYLWDKAAAKDAFRKAMDIAHGGARKVALTLSDPFCVERHRAEFLELAERHVDILFANEAEIVALYQAKGFADAVAQVRAHRHRVVVVTRSARRPLRRRLPLRGDAWPRPGELRTHRLDRRGRNHRAFRRPPGGLARCPCSRKITQLTQAYRR
jgi:sugar/nucleoside kinase (ribokinase family)